MNNSPDSKALRSLRRYSLAGAGGILVLFAGLGAWAAVTELSGAVIASGQLVVESDVKAVQHPVGGIVGELRVRDGDRVHAGDILVRLDATETEANLDILIHGLDELSARQAREEAEHEGAAEIDFPESLLSRSNDPRIAKLIDGEERFFKTRKASRDGQKAQLTQRISQLQQQIEGLRTQVDAKKRETELIQQELESIRKLWEKQLVQMDRVISMERDFARVQGDRGALEANIAQVKDKITETELQILQVDADMRAEVGKDLADIRARSAELQEKRITAEDQLKRIDVRAPQEGTVHELAVHTVGGVIEPGQKIMLIVPTADALAVEAKVSPQQIDQLYLGQLAILRFTSFNQRTTPEINGEVSRISPDVTQDPRTGVAYYTIRVKLFTDELARLKAAKLVPGMPVEAFMKTSPQTVVSYLTRPLYDQARRAFTER